MRGRATRTRGAKNGETHLYVKLFFLHFQPAVAVPDGIRSRNSHV
jgi:hypothetical protein